VDDRAMDDDTDDHMDHWGHHDNEDMVIHHLDQLDVYWVHGIDVEALEDLHLIAVHMDHLYLLNCYR
jgi:hypothetical protein